MLMSDFNGNLSSYSVLKTILSKWFDERVIYKNKMKQAYKAGNKADILEKVGTFKYMRNGKLVECESLMDFQDRVEQILNKETEVIHITWSMTPNGI